MTGVSLSAGQSPGNRSNEERSKIEIKIGKNKTIGFLVAQKMLNKFLTCDRIITKEERCLRYSEEELAKKLNITVDGAKRLNFPCFYKAMASKIKTPLIHLYCSTKWADGEFKEK
jgi:hypothetical protein